MERFLRSCRRLVLLLVVALACQGCGGAHEGWRRLWPEQWAWVHRGRILERGVPAEGRVVTAEHRSVHLRTSLFNHGGQRAHVSFRGSRLDRAWELASGERKFVDVRLPKAGSYRFSASTGVTLGEPRMGRPLTQPKLVVLVLVDTLRADHVNRDLTPEISSFFSQGRRWREASADAPWTVPSVAALFTSRPVLDLTTPEGDLLGVPEGIPTWAQALDRAGFSGGAVVANYTIQVLNGFGKGFDSFMVPDGHGSSRHPDASWVVENARAWLAAHRGENGFLYLHLMDPHEPYRDHSGQGRVAPKLQPFAHRERVATAAETALFRDLYAGEVRHVDEVLAPFLRDLAPNAVVALTADHGEALGEHGCWGHGLNLYREALEVPFMLRGPGVPAGNSDQPEQLIDLAPTLLQLAGVDREPSMIGRSALSGGSRAPLVAVTFGAGPLRWCWRRGADKVVIRMAPQPGLTSVARSTMEEANPLPTGAEVFNLDQDPHEDRPLPLEGELALAAGQAFVATTARFVPGLQLMAWGQHGRLALSLDVSGQLEPAQVFAVGPVVLHRQGDRLTLSCREAFPVCGIAGPVRPRPRHIELPASGYGWIGHGAGGAVPLTDLAEPPALQATGVLVWWNPPRERLVKGYQETLRRLRDLGYLQ